MIGDLISAGASLLGGYFNREAQSDANQLALQDKERDRALQREFAQSGIQWKVEDAKKAGIHPLFALGGNTATYSPSAVSIGSTSMGDEVAKSGQDIGRAINATRSTSERDDAFSKSVKVLQLRKMGLENDLLASQIAKLGPATPGMPSDGKKKLVDGQGDAPPAPEHTGLRGGGLGVIDTDPTISDAQKFEDRYGELSDYTFGPYVMWRDYRKNYKLPGTYLDERLGRRRSSGYLDEINRRWPR